MFDEFCLEDTRQTCAHADRVIYHLDGPEATRHLPTLLAIEALHCIQWVQGAGKPPPSQWLRLLQRVQEAGKSVQVLYSRGHGGDADLDRELDALCGALDPDRLFFWATVDSMSKADELVAMGQSIGHGT